MFDRFLRLMAAMLNAIVGKLEFPMLDQTVVQLQSEMIQVRQELAESIATAKQLEIQLERQKERITTKAGKPSKPESEPEDLAALEQSLEQQTAKTKELRERCHRIELELEQRHAQIKMVNIQRKAAGEPFYEDGSDSAGPDRKHAYLIIGCVALAVVLCWQLARLIH